MAGGRHIQVYFLRAGLYDPGSFSVVTVMVPRPYAGKHSFFTNFSVCDSK